MRQDVDFNDFTGGELSPRLKGRTDYKKYFQGSETLLNFVVLPQGGVTRRPGTQFAALAKDQTDEAFRVRSFPFSFSTVQDYDLEFGEVYIRVFKDDGPVLNEATVGGAANNGGGLIRLTLSTTAGLYTGNTMTVAQVTGTVEANGVWPVTVIDATHVDLQGSAFVHAYVSGGATATPVEIPSPYAASDIAFLSYTQSADTLYLLGGDCPGNNGVGYATYTLGRSSHTVWTLAKLPVRDGPYLKLNTTATTLTPSGTSGSITVTASSVVGINATAGNTGQGFLATDIGRHMRLQQTNWAWGVVTAVADTTHCTLLLGNGATANNYQGANVALDSTAATAAWQLGKWSDTTGYPTLATFFQNRLALCGTVNEPNALELSVTGDFPNFAPTQADNSVTAINALDWIISDDQVNAVRWLSAAGSAASMQLGIGTTGGEDVLGPATTTQGLSSTNVQVYRETQLGAARNVRAVRIGKAVLFANFPGRKVHEWQWAWAVNGYLGPDRTVDAEHITRSQPAALQGITEMVYQQHPNGVVWCRRGDGALISLTYLPEQNVIAWARHQLGGEYYGGPPIVEGLSCIPSPDATYSELWLTVLRTVAGVPTRTREVMTRYFDGLPQEQAFFVDCGVSSALTFPAGTLSFTALSGNDVTFTNGGATFSVGTVGSLIRVNQGVAVVRAYIDASHVSGDWYYPAARLKPAANGAWSCTPQLGHFTGLDHLDGETVQILGDGADYGVETVAAGAIDLAAGGAAAFVTAGLPQTYDLVTMPFAPRGGIALSTAGKPVRIDHLYLRIHESLEAFAFGSQRTDPMTDAVDFPHDIFDTRSAGDRLGLAPPLLSKLQRVPFPGGFDLEGQIRITGNGPFPLTLLAIGAKADIGEMPAAAQ